MTEANPREHGENLLARFKDAKLRRGDGWNSKRWKDFTSDLHLFRAALTERPSGDMAFGAGDCVVRAIESGLIQPAMIEVMAAEARQFFWQAMQLVPGRSDAVTARWARLEIVALHPKAALAMLDDALARATDGPMRQQLIALQEDAWFASYQT